MYRRILNFLKNQPRQPNENSTPEVNRDIVPTNITCVLSDRQIRLRSKSFDEKYKTVLAKEEKCTDCAICLGGIKENDKYKELECKHKYHEQCIRNWVVIKNKQKCPMCNSLICGMNEIIVKG